MSSDAVAYREVVDKYGRSYRVGESPEQLTGMPRWVFIIVPWIAMMLISTFEYGWGTAEDTLGKVYGWDLNKLSWLFTMWVIFEAGAAFPPGGCENAASSHRAGRCSSAGSPWRPRSSC